MRGNPSDYRKAKGKGSKEEPILMRMCTTGIRRIFGVVVGFTFPSFFLCPILVCHLGYVHSVWLINFLTMAVPSHTKRLSVYHHPK